MGAGSRAGKFEMHSSGKPTYNKNKCIGCRACFNNCALDAISFDENNKATLNENNCSGCGRCIGMCKYDAISTDWSEGSSKLNCKIAEYAYAVVKGKPSFHLNFIMDVSPDCDCEGTNDLPIVPNIGILASTDPLAIDVASIDLINDTQMINGYEDKGHDHFKAIHPHTDHEAGFKQAHKIGLGNISYEIIKI
jgi:uncharacterized Fe-S center protein